MKETIVSYIKSHKGSIATIVVMSILMFMTVRDFVHACKINSEIVKLNSEKHEYQESITRDSTLIERLKNDEELERYARETFYMTRDNEDLFIIK